MAISITAETPLQDDVRALVQALNDHLNPLSPPEFQFQMSVEDMANSETTLFVARDETGRALGMGALYVHSAELAEVKRMYTLPETRGSGIGRFLLNAIETLARETGIAMLKLETGSVAGFESAWRLYERGGFTRCPAFLNYPDSEYSAYFEKQLEPVPV